MKILKFISKIWHDPVWSKVIAAGIIIVIGSIIANISLDINAIINFTIHYCTLYFREIIILLLLITLIIIILKFVFPKRKKFKPNINWFKKYVNNESYLENYFLLWFPLNGTMKSTTSSLEQRYNTEILHSRIIKPLLDNNIITFNIDSSVEITDKVYDILDDAINRKLIEGHKIAAEAISIISEMNFYDLIQSCINNTEYNNLVSKKNINEK